MKTRLNRPVNAEDIESKGFPFQCENCGNKPAPGKVIEYQGSCEICGDSIIAYSVDTAEYIVRMSER